jgi:hemerythrin-like domain-containing protein
MSEGKMGRETKANAIEMLLEDHRLIEQVLDSLENFLELPWDGSSARRAVRDFANFLENFADRYHHEKEEKFLFVKMNAYGFTREFGTMAAMLAGHEEARLHSDTLAAIGRGSGPLTQKEWETVRAHGLTCIPLLRWDIQKEENILYPLAEENLPARVMEELADQLREFEFKHVGTRRRFRTLADSLTVRYPPVSSRQLRARFGSMLASR